MRRVASDTGGTFTDLVLDDGTITKVPSTRDDPSEAVRAGIHELLGGDGSGADDGDGERDELVLVHGTTVATNAVLERRGAAVALVTNEGFADLIEIARQDRPSLYDQSIDRPVPLVPRPWRYEVRGRLAADGTELEPIDVATLAVIDPAVEAVAVCLLHSDLCGDHERAVGDELTRRGIEDVTLSCELSPELREYERTATTVGNAYVRPTCRRYVRALATAADSVMVMTSAGGLVPADEAAEQPARLLLSGPAGGVLAGAAVAVINGWPDAITFDMGGTSTDVCLVLDGRPEPAGERSVGGLPVRLPSLDVHTVGAGGGSIARIDDGGALVVGPESAGARPGPACYGHGGTQPTVTDANVVAGRIPADASLPGIGRLDGDAAARSLAAAGVEATDVLAVVDANMEQALRHVSTERGVDPRRLALVAFGGAGPLHACALADALEMPVVLVPPRAGVFSAVGILGAPRQVDLVESWPTPVDHGGIGERLAVLMVTAIARATSGDDNVHADVPVVTVALDCRYAGQSHELRVPTIDAFHDEHERRNGYARWHDPVEVIALRVTATLAAPASATQLPPVDRSGAVGPTVIAETDCTIWVPPGWQAELGVAGTLVLRRVGA